MRTTQSSSGIQSKRPRAKGVVAALLGALALLPLLLAAPTPAAYFDPFDLQLKALGTTNSLAGKPTDFVLEIKKARTGCYYLDRSLGLVSGCKFSFDPDNPAAPEVPPREFRIQQDLKKIVVKNLGNTVVPNPNAFGDKFCDPRHIWLPSTGGKEWLLWQCRDTSLPPLGTGYIEIPACHPDSFSLDNPDQIGRRRGHVSCPEDIGFPGQGVQQAGAVNVYAGAPQAGEAARLIVLYPKNELDLQVSRVETSIKVATSSAGLAIEARADDIPDIFDVLVNRPRGCLEEVRRPDGSGCVEGARLSAQPDVLRLTLPGQPYAGRPPLMTNATTCEGQQLGFESQGYLNNALFDDPGYVASTKPFHSKNGWGDGKTVTASRPYKATGCAAVKFDPQIRITADGSDNASKIDHVPAIDATIAQNHKPSEFEAAIGKVVTQFDAKDGVTVNLDNKATFCARADFEAGKCAPESEVGRADATSPILYENQAKLFPGTSSKCQGKVSLLGLKGDEVEIGIRLLCDIGGQRDVPLILYGAGKVQGTKLRVEFNNPYKNVPISSFGLHLSGARDKGLLKTTKLCPASPQVTTTLTNQNGDKSVVRSQTLRITGCKDPTFNAELSETEAGKPTTLTLQLAGNTKLATGSLSFNLPSDLMLATKQGKRSTSATTDGSLKVETPDGSLQAPFALSGSGSNLALGTLSVQGASPALMRLSGSVSLNSATLPAKQAKKKGHKKAKKRKRAKKASKTQKKVKRVSIKLNSTGTGELKLQGLPQEITGAELNLGNNARPVFLITANKCGATLPFTANLKTAEGKTVQLSDSVRLDPCQKQRATGKKKRKTKRTRKGA